MRYAFLTVSMWTLLAGFSGCVVKEEPYHHHHERVYYEDRPVVEERVEVR